MHEVARRYRCPHGRVWTVVEQREPYRMRGGGVRLPNHGGHHVLWPHGRPSKLPVTLKKFRCPCRTLEAAS